jgi:hypothetical protein
MYYTEQDPFTGNPIFVEKNLKRKEQQKDFVVYKPSIQGQQSIPKPARLMKTKRQK